MPPQSRFPRRLRLHSLYFEAGRRRPNFGKPGVSQAKPELRNRALEKAQVAQASGTSDGDSSNFGEVGISHANIRSSR
jgi:hypothetical protein